MLVNSHIILQKAYKENYAVGAYNINSLECAKYILEACNNDKSPVIISVTESMVNYFGGYKVISSYIKALIVDLNIKIPVALHLDYAKSIESCMKAIDSGFTSVMVDVSDKNIEENIEMTSAVVEYARKNNVTVEAKIESLDGMKLSDPLECAEFVSQTNIDILSPSFGNKCNGYVKKDTLDFRLLGEISKNCKLPLTLDGAYGLDDNKIKTAIFCGVNKVNINMDIQVSWSNEIRKYLRKNRKVNDPIKIISLAEESIKRIIHNKNELLGSKNKAFN